MKNPIISIIIPTYNREKLIIKALNSIFNQTFQDFEILIIDDASTDNTRNVVENLKNQKIRYYRLDKNGGQCVARNYGIKRASGKYIAFLDSDDEWLPEKLGSQLKCFEEGPDNMGAVYGQSYQRFELSGTTAFKDGPYYRGNIYDKFSQGFCPPTPSLFLVRKDVLEKVNYFDEQLITFVDLDLWLRISREYLFDFVEHPIIIKYEQIGDQYVNNFMKRYNGYRLFLKKWKDEIVSKNGSKGFMKLRTHLANSITRPFLTHPPSNIRQFSGKILRLLIEIRSTELRLYIKALMFLVLGFEISSLLILKARSSKVLS